MVGACCWSKGVWPTDKREFETVCFRDLIRHGYIWVARQYKVRQFGLFLELRAPRDGCSRRRFGVALLEATV
jgi:hypothetical protein